MLPSDTAIRSGKAKDETAHVLVGSDGYDGPGMGIDAPPASAANAGRVGVRSAAAVPGDHARLIILVASDWHQD